MNNFDVLKRMSLENKDIALFPDVLNMTANKKGTKITVGVPGNPISNIYFGRKRAVLLMFDVKQFDELKQLMESENNAVQTKEE